MMTETVRSRSNREVGQAVEGKTILEKRVVIAPDPANRRMGVYEYIVAASRQDKRPGAVAVSSAGSTRETPEERGVGLIRRLGTH